MSKDGAGFPKYMIEVDDNRPKQMKLGLPLRLVLRDTSRGRVCYFIGGANLSVSLGVTITSVNGTSVPDVMAITTQFNGSDQIVGFLVKNDVTDLNDFDFKINKKK